MSESSNISLSVLWQFLEKRNKKIKDKFTPIYMKDVQEILMKAPFYYSVSIASELAGDIVNYGNKIMRCFACLDSDDPPRISLRNLLNFLEQRNRKIKDKVSGIYMGKVKEILMKPPFSYSEFIASDVADGVVNYGDRLMPNCMDCDDDDGKIDEVHEIGGSFQTLQENITLKIISGDDHGIDVYRFYTIDERFISDSRVEDFADTLAAVREFLKTKAQKGFTATIVMLCGYTEDGLVGSPEDKLVFTSGLTVPVSCLETHIQQMLVGDHMLPMVVDLVMIKDGRYHRLSQIHSYSMPIDLVHIKDGRYHPIPQIQSGYENIDRIIIED